MTAYHQSWRTDPAIDMAGGRCQDLPELHWHGFRILFVMSGPRAGCGWFNFTCAGIEAHTDYVVLTLRTLQGRRSSIVDIRKGPNASPNTAASLTSRSARYATACPTTMRTGPGSRSDCAATVATAAYIVGEKHVTAAALLLLPVGGFDFQSAG